MKMCNCLCSVCEKKFERPLKEVKRNMERKRAFYCSRSCSASGNKGLRVWCKSSGNLANLVKGYDNTDKYTPFREILRRAKRRDKEFDLDLDYLSELWVKQGGKCPYLGISLVLPTTNRKYDKSNPNYIASLDRINSAVGYIKGNVQYVALTLNYAKNAFEESVILNLLELIRGHDLDSTT